jgi:hypothetical protein
VPYGWVFLVMAGATVNADCPASLKKGVGFWNADGRFAEFARFVDQLGSAWYYNWTPHADAGRIAAEFVPMVWSGRDVTEQNLAALRARKPTALLGFNEPDGKEQANMTVEDALDLWPKLEATGIRLGSPAPASVSGADDWLGRFMAGAKERGLRVDFVCLHWYGDITAPDAVERLRAFLEREWKRFGRPLWLTEFSGSTGYWIQAENPPVTPKKNAEFLSKALPMLESLPYLERFAWFELIYTEPPWADVALVDPESGAITKTGRVFRKFPGRTGH